METIFKAVGLAMMSIGTTVIRIEATIFDKFDYIAPVYNKLVYVQSLLSSVSFSSTPMHPKSIYRRQNSSNNKSSSGRHRCTFFARKRINRKRSIISGSNLSMNDSINQAKYYQRVRADPRSKSNTASRTIPFYFPVRQRKPGVFKSRRGIGCPTVSFDPSNVPYIDSSIVTSKLNPYVLANQVLSHDDTVSFSNVPPHAKPNNGHKHMKVRSVGRNIGPRNGVASITIDSASSINLFKDKSLLDDIKTNDKLKLKVRTSDSTFHVDEVGVPNKSIQHLPLSTNDDYYYYPNGVTNILSLALLAKNKRVFMDTAVENAFHVYNEDGSYIRFVPTSNGMYCLDVGPDNEPCVMAVQTVKDEQSKFSNIDCTRAEAVRKLQEVLACPSDYDLANAVENNVIGNTPFTRRDVRIAKQIYGPDVAALKGKTVKQQSKMPREDESKDIPPYIAKEYHDVHLSIDVMHVNGITFLISFSKHIGLIQSYCIRKSNKQKYLDGILAMLIMYRSRQPLQVTTMEADGAFEAIRQDLQDKPYEIALTTCDADRHVEIIERQIRFVKERIRSVRMMLPYKRLPKRFLIELVSKVTVLMNSLPKKGGIHRIMSPRELVTGKKLRVPEHHIGQYVQGLTGGNNDTGKERSVDALYIGRADNGSGHTVFKLSTKQVVSVNRVKVISPTVDHIKFVEDMAEAEGQPEGLEFADINGKITLEDFMEAINDDGDDDSNASDDDFLHDDEYQKEFNEEVRLENSEGLATDEDQADAFHNEISHLVQDPNDRPALKNSRLRPRTNGRAIVALSHKTEECGKKKKKKNEKKRTKFNSPADPTTEVDDDDDDYHDALSEHPVPDELVSVDDAKPGVCEAVEEDPDAKNSGVNEVPPGLDCSLNHEGYWGANAHSTCAYVLNTIASFTKFEASKSTPQYGFNRGMKEFGDLGFKATMKELDDNLIGMNAVRMLKPSEVNKEVWSKALSYLMFLKRKRTGDVKARGCADGRPQREYISKDESSSPTVSIYALMASCLMDAIDERKVVTCDIPGAFLQADWPAGDDCFLKFENVMVDMICQIDPKYKSSVIKRGNKKFIFAKLNKAVYGTLLGAILFYEKLSKQLDDWGYVKNNYDPCTFNKVINGEQVTIQFHVDDLKISHKEQKVLDDILYDLNIKFGTKKKALSASTGLIHEYLGITISFDELHKVKFTMFDYLEDILSEMPSDMDGIARTPAQDDLFTVDEHSPLLNEKDADFYHRTTARLLFAAKRARPDLQVAVAYMCTRVKAPTVSDCHKLGRTIKYLRGTIYMPLVLGWDGSGVLTWSVDASFAIHNDMRSHTGAVLSLGQGALMSMSSKQKINTKSSTEAELVGVDDAMNFVVWIQLFMGEQMKTVSKDSALSKFMHETVILQDNTSTIQLEKNGKQSSTKRTRHINIRYFYVTSKIKNGDVRVVYCPTKEMVSDYLTKPLQGSLFRTHRNSIMGLSDDDISRYYDEYLKMKGDLRNTK